MFCLLTNFNLYLKIIVSVQLQIEAKIFQFSLEVKILQIFTLGIFSIRMKFSGNIQKF